MKYKVILADDEEEVLESIHRNLIWERYGFEVVDTFLNGRDVLEFLETQEADLVITDIRMPFMDGIELSRQIRERYPQIKIIIISGYGDFRYAKEAMSYRVMDYILKPVNAKEMGEVLQRAKEALEKEMEERKNIDLLKKQYLENLPVIRDNMLNRLIEGNVCWKILNEKLKNCGVFIADAAFWTVALIQTDKADKQAEVMDEQYMPVYIRHLIEEHFKGSFNSVVFYSKMGECVIFGMKEPEEITQILSRFHAVARESKKVMGIRLAIGVGKIKDTMTEIKASFEEAREALMYRRMAEDNCVIYMEDIDISEQNFVFLDDESRDMLFSVIKFGDEDGIRCVLDGIHHQLKTQDMSMNACQVWLISMLNAMLLFVKQYTPMMEAEFFGVSGEVFDCMKVLGKYGDMDSFFRWLEERCLSLGIYFAKERSSKAQNTIDVAKKYIQKEFGNPNMSLELAAEYIGVTPTYFSALFKKETGETFVEYLTSLRLEQAKRMLDQTEEKIYAIAEKTGYMDAGYFSHVFKKKYGMSPIGYRRQKQ